jgi:hypothetical protein
LGYTHYFNQNRSFTTFEWEAIRKFSKRIIKVNKDILGDMMGEGGKPEAGKNCIAFNGIGDMAHESFAINREHDVKDRGNFCKTAEKPYDVCVVAVLCFINYVAPGALDISSDGRRNDWMVGLEVSKNLSGYDDIGFPPGVQESRQQNSV